MAVSCGGTQYRDPARAKGTMEWGPKDIQITTNTMVDSIYSYLIKDWKGPAIIRVKGIKNKSSQLINKKLLVNNIVESLIEKKIAIEESAFIKETMELIEMDQGGLMDKNFSIPVGKLQSPNFYLTGRIDDNVRYQGGKEYNYLVVNFWLINNVIGRRVWQKKQVFYKVGTTRKIGF